jgi:hypothetical protein
LRVLANEETVFSLENTYVRTENLTDSWGVPDWREAANYGDVDSWSNSRWRWEFLRRRDDLRKFFDLWASITHQKNLPEKNGLCPTDPGFVAFEADVPVTRAWETFGLVGIPNPRIGNQPDRVIRRQAHPLNPNETKDGRSSAGRARGVIAVLEEYDVGYYQITLAPNELAFKFDLNRPLPDQIKAVSLQLKREQKARFGKLKVRRRRPKNWLGYLRTLDARDANASWAQIAELHPNTAQTEQTARDIWNQADALRFKF